MNVGFAFTIKDTINKQHVAHHFILEYLKIKTFQGRTIDLKTNEIVDQFTALTFPNIGYRVEFWSQLKAEHDTKQNQLVSEETERAGSVCSVQVVGLEPTRLTAPDPKSGLSTNFNTPAT